MNYHLRPPSSNAERVLANSVAYFIGNRRNQGHRVADIMFGVDAKWPDIPFKIVLAAFTLEQARRERREAGAVLQ